MAHSSRENMTYQAAVFRKDLPEAVKVLAEVVSKPRILPDELEEVKETTRFEIKESEWKMDVILLNVFNAIAFGGAGVEDAVGKTSSITGGIKNLFGKSAVKDDAVSSTASTLGRPLLCDADTLDRITPDVIREYRSTWFTPDRMVVAEFGSLPTPPPSLTQLQTHLSTPALYTGGIVVEDTTGKPRSPNPDDRPLTHVYIAFEAPSMADPDIYALATLSTLMGGGGSFSAGGPGKGMYTRLYTQVLNRFGWVESCNMLSFPYIDTGLFGITASVPPSFQTHEHVAHILCFTREELDRAKNQLKSNLLMSLESRSVELEDIARQVMAQKGKRIGVTEMCRRVDSLKEDDLVRVARRVVLGEEVKSPLDFGDGRGW
ncbi:Metalloenzyme, LuxS/M16 peptidase-like protein [Chytridium lagenaria]|nr:Metalloenzyme, LuxS/M16 peptidase-like protein [Chytridium lagenaria]